MSSQKESKDPFYKSRLNESYLNFQHFKKIDNKYIKTK